MSLFIVILSLMVYSAITGIAVYFINPKIEAGLWMCFMWPIFLPAYLTLTLLNKMNQKPRPDSTSVKETDQ